MTESINQIYDMKQRKETYGTRYNIRATRKRGAISFLRHCSPRTRKKERKNTSFDYLFSPSIFISFPIPRRAQICCFVEASWKAHCDFGLTIPFEQLKPHGSRGQAKRDNPRGGPETKTSSTSPIN